MSETITCETCQRQLPAEQFPKINRFGMNCSECRKRLKKEYNREYREKHRDSLNFYLKEYRKENKTVRPEGYNEARNRAAKERYQNDPEYRAKILERATRYRANKSPEQKARDRETSRQYQNLPKQRELRRKNYLRIKNNPEAYAKQRQEGNEYKRTEARKAVIREHRRQHPDVYKNREHRRRVRERDQTPELFDLSAHTNFLKLWQQNRCYYCNSILPPENTDIEHIVPISRSGEHASKNIVLSCKSCNAAKGAKILWKEWRPVIKDSGKAILEYSESANNPALMVSTFQLSDRTTSDSISEFLRLRAENPDKLLLFDWEVFSRPAAVKNLVLSRNREHTPISGHKFTVEELSPDMVRNFFELYHLQGHTASSVYLGLVKDAQIMGAASFRIKGKGAEFTRMAFNGCILGGFSKLFNYFVNKWTPEFVLSYSDSRYASGNSFRQLGFSETGASLPHPSYVGPSGMFHRMSLSKREMPNVFKFFEPEHTEFENARYNGYYRVQGLPLSRWVWRK